MKGKMIVLTVVLFSLPIVVFAQTEIKITLPNFAGLFGLGPKTDVVITNATPFMGSVCAFSEKVVDLAPGLSCWDRRSFEFDYTELPIAVRMYTWENGRFGEFVGAATKVLEIRRGSPTTWVIQTSDVRRPDGDVVLSGFGFAGSSFPAPDVMGKPMEVDFPRIDLKSTVAIQFVNLNYFQSHVRLNGRELANLRSPGEIFTASYWNKFNRSVPVEVEVIFYDRGRLCGSYHDLIYLGNGPDAIQYVLTPQMIRRY